MNYKQWRNKRQEEVNALPLHFAFSDKQFQEVLEKTGAKGAEDFYRFGDTGGFYLKKDAPIIHAFLDKPDELSELIKDYDWAKDAFLYEMGNHEYHINWQGDWDVMNCFTPIEYRDEDTGEYLNRIPWETQTKKAYLDAAREFYRMCDEKEWW